MSLFPVGLDVLTSSVNNILCEAINKLELKVGIDDSADTNSLDYKINNYQAFPVGSVFISVLETNPGTLLGYGTWAAIAAGKVLIGIDSEDGDFDTVKKTGGAKTQTPSSHTGTAVGNHVFTQPAAHSNHVFTQPDNHSISAHAGSAVGAHDNHVFTQPAAHSNHVFTQADNHSAISAHSGSGVDAHSAHAGTAVDAHAAHTHAYGTIAVAQHNAKNTDNGADSSLHPSGSTGTHVAAATHNHNITAYTHSVSGSTGDPSASLTHAVTQPSAHSNHVFTQADNHSAISAHSGAGVDAHSAHAGGAVDAHSAHSVTQPSAHDALTHSNGAVDAHSAHSGGAVDAHSVTQPSAHSAMSIIQPYFVVYIWERTA